jgi:hypothetical protein
MRVAEIPNLGAALDDMLNGRLSSLQAMCDERGWDLHLVVQTEIEGLPPDKMKLAFHAFEGDKTVLFFDVDVDGRDERILAWNIYLHECTTNARRHLESAQRSLQRLDMTAENPVVPQNDVELVAALRGILGQFQKTGEA